MGMNGVNMEKRNGWWHASMLLALFLPLMSSQNEQVDLTRGRMLQLANVIEQVYEQTGSYPQSLEATALTGVTDGLAAHEYRDAWGKRLIYTFRNPKTRQRAGEYWLGSSCGKPFFGGFLRFILGQNDCEGDDLVLRNGVIIQEPKQDKDSKEDFA